jgi:hypothetical protein
MMSLGEDLAFVKYFCQVERGCELQKECRIGDRRRRGRKRTHLGAAFPDFELSEHREFLAERKVRVATFSSDVSVLIEQNELCEEEEGILRTSTL